jgi:glycosyltransferase involved in cell wall biosynthesis
MSKQKKKVLFVTEATYLNSGYSIYGHELLTRLHKSGKYEIAEHSSYGNMSDPRVKFIPWKYYANAPEETDSQELKTFYKSRPTHEFGEWRFDKVSLDFRPDVVACIRDPWMDSFIQNSHLRPYYSVLMMPTADSLYLDFDWINTYSKADGALTYTEWGKRVLDHESGGKINTLGAAPYGVDYDVFSPVENKEEHKKRFGLPPDSIIIGTVMRNQKRKLFPDLIQAFADSLDRVPENVSSKMYLYLHTSYPDKQCWDLPRLILESGVASRVLVSYICKFCKKASPQIFKDARTLCPHCNNVSCVMPNVGLGYTNEQLIDTYRLFDLYCQYSISEGFGCPLVEAAAIGVPVVTVDFSAMQDFADRVGAYKVKIQRHFREFESHMLRAYPDNKHLTEIITKFVQLPPDYRKKKGEQMRAKAKPYYNWDRVAGVWANAIDNLPKPKRNWNDPPNIRPGKSSIADNLSSDEFVRSVFADVYYMPEHVHEITGLNLLRDLNFGATVTSKGMEQLDKKKVVERLKGRNDGRNIAEQARCGIIKLNDEEFIRFANTRNVK